MIWPFKRRHKHKWVVNGWQADGSKVGFYCPECRARTPNYPTSPEEQAFLQQESHLDFMWREDRATTNHETCLHKLWWDFQEKVLGSEERGYPLMCLVDEWIEKQNPERAIVVGCDDDHFMSSDIVLIENSRTKPPYYMGVEFTFIPQNGKEPVSLFLYPGHLAHLHEELGKLLKQARKIQKLQEQHEKRRRKQMKKLFKHPDPYLEI